MIYDLAVGTRVYVDVTLPGLEALPGPGEERFARDLVVSPGGAGITAVGAARLGLSVAVVAPLGRDALGRHVRGALESEGVACVGPESERTPVTVVMPAGDDRAMATFDGGDDGGDPFALDARAVVVCALDPRPAADGSPWVYACVGSGDAEALAGEPPDLEGVRALFANRREAALLTGLSSPEDAASALAASAETAVVTLAAGGAVAACGDAVVHVPAPPVEVVDTTGAGDLFLAAYAAADLAGLPLEERLERACVYAALSVRTVTGAAGAATRDQLEEALRHPHFTARQLTPRSAP